MPSQVSPGEPTWRLDVIAFEQAAAQFLFSNGVHTDAQRKALVDGASSALVTAMVKALFNCVVVS